jgi:hypothetical protein
VVLPWTINTSTKFYGMTCLNWYHSDLMTSIWYQFKQTTSDGCKFNLYIVSVTLFVYSSRRITLLTCALSHVRECIQMWTLQMGKAFQTHWLCPVLQSHMHTCPDRHLPLWRDLQDTMSLAVYTAHTARLTTVRYHNLSCIHSTYSEAYNCKISWPQLCTQHIQWGLQLQDTMNPAVYTAHTVRLTTARYHELNCVHSTYSEAYNCKIPWAQLCTQHIQWGLQMQDTMSSTVYIAHTVSLTTARYQELSCVHSTYSEAYNCKIPWAQLCTQHIHWGLQLQMLKELKHLPFMSQYILSQLIYVVKNRDQFFINSEIHNIHTRHSSKLQLPLENIDIYQKCTIQVLRFLIDSLSKLKKFSNNLRTFKSVLKHFIIHKLLLFIKWIL